MTVPKDPLWHREYRLRKCESAHGRPTRLADMAVALFTLL